MHNHFCRPGRNSCEGTRRFRRVGSNFPHLILVAAVFVLIAGNPAGMADEQPGARMTAHRSAAR